MAQLNDVIKKPLISEKGTALSESLGVYSFLVDRGACKTEIKSAIEKLFKVNVVSVNTMIVHGKNKRFGRFATKRPNWKKASVRLKAGQKIELFQGV